MSFSLDVADLLLLDHRESFLRSSIGRSYYAAYLEARSFCERFLGFVRTASSREHQQVATLMVELDASIADTLRFLRRYRNTADYDITVSDQTVRLTADRSRRSAAFAIASLDAHAERLERERAAASDAGEDDPSPIPPSR